MMKKWIILAFASCLLSVGFHFYLAKRSYELTAGKASESVVCNINEKISCDKALLSPYAKVFNISLSSFGFGFNLTLALILLSFLLGMGVVFYWKIVAIYLSGLIAIPSLFMIGVSFVEDLYCPFCWTTYFLSFLCFGSLFWAFRKDVLKVSPIKFIFQSLKDRTSYLTFAILIGVSFFLHMIFVVNLGIKDNKKEFQALLIDWKQSPVIDFSVAPPLFKKESSESKITIVEFADFLCPNCKHVQPSLKQFLKTYKNVSFHFYTFPLDGVCNSYIPHKGTGTSCLLSKATICAEQQGQKAWEFHNLIFKSQESFGKHQANKKKVKELLENLAQEVHLDSKAFFKCIESPETDAHLKKVVNLGIKAKLQGTPTFFVNGRMLNRFSNDVAALFSYVYNSL